MATADVAAQLPWKEPLVLSACADFLGTGLVVPMLISTMLAAGSAAASLLLSPETLGKELVPDLVVA